MASVLSAAQAAYTSTPVTGPRKWAQTLCTRLLRKSVSDIADAIGKDESAASRVRASERAITVAEFCDLLQLVDLKLVDTGMQCVPADELAMLRRVYAAHHHVDLWTDPE